MASGGPPPEVMAALAQMTQEQRRQFLVAQGVPPGAVDGALSQLGFSDEPASSNLWRVRMSCAAGTMLALALSSLSLAFTFHSKPFDTARLHLIRRCDSPLPKRWRHAAGIASNEGQSLSCGNRISLLGHGSHRGVLDSCTPRCWRHQFAKRPRAHPFHALVDTQ